MLVRRKGPDRTLQCSRLPYHILPPELRERVMAELIATDPVSAVMLACTCWDEWHLYMSLRDDSGLSYRAVVMEYADCQHTPETVWGKRGTQDILFPGERGYAYFKRRHAELMCRWVRPEFVRPLLAKKRKEKQRQMRHLMHSVAHGDYESAAMY